MVVPAAWVNETPKVSYRPKGYRLKTVNITFRNTIFLS